MKFYVISILLVAGITARAMDNPNLHAAAANNDFEVIQKQTENNPHALQLLTAQDDFGRTPLHWAAAKGYNAIVSYIVIILQRCLGDDNATIALLNQRDYYGRTAAELANANGHDSIVDNLVYDGAQDPRITGNIRPKTPYPLYATNPSPELVVPRSTLHYYFTKAFVGFMMAVIIGTQFLQHTHQGSCSNPD